MRCARFAFAYRAEPMDVPEAVLVAVSGTLAGGVRKYAAGRAVRELGKFCLWVLGWTVASLLVPHEYRAVSWAAWGGYVALGAAVLPGRGRLRLVCPPGCALRLGMTMFVCALSRSGGELARAAAWLVAAEYQPGGSEEKRPRWLRRELQEFALKFLLRAGVARRLGAALVYAKPGELTPQAPSGDGGAATNSPTDRSRAGSLPQ